MERSLLRFVDPHTVGPGQWFCIHLKAKEATTLERKREFVLFVRKLFNELRCLDCKGHALDYLNNHPIEPFFDMRNSEGEDIGCFEWSWRFHNDVNQRLGKKIMPWNDVYNFFYHPEKFRNQDTTCKTCGHSTEKITGDRVVTGFAPLITNFKLLPRYH